MATLAFSLTGALAAIRRGYDIVGVFFLALVSGIGGGWLRDGIFIRDEGPTLLLADERYIEAVAAATVLGAALRPSAAQRSKAHRDHRCPRPRGVRGFRRAKIWVVTLAHRVSCPDCDRVIALPAGAQAGDTVECGGRRYRLTLEYGAFGAEPVSEPTG